MWGRGVGSQRPSALLSDGLFLLWRRIELSAVNGLGGGALQGRAAALSSIGLLHVLLGGGCYSCS